MTAIPGTPEVAAAFHAYWKKRIGYCHHETGYKRCEADAEWVTTALGRAGLAIGEDALSGSQEPSA